jgi:molybdopterin synthase catalytic subunit
MIRSLRLTHTPLDTAGAGPGTPAPTSPTAGAVLTFLGVVRNREGEAPILGLHYESFEAMAEHQFRKLFDQLEARWPQIESVDLVHRLGFVPVAEPSLRIEVMAPHRREAFAACEWLIDEMKRVVPIWKRAILATEGPSANS